MDGKRQYSLDELDSLSYRTLQQMAKSMGLPSNVKKIYLVQLIHAKSTKSLQEVENIIVRVRFERQQLSHGNKRRPKKKVQMQHQDMEVSSTMGTSPPINVTPKRTLVDPDPNGLYVRCQLRPDPPRNKSDRILRSYNAKNYKRPNYSLINNPIFDLVKAGEKCDNSKAQISISRHGERVNLTARSVTVKKIQPHKPNVSTSVLCLKKNTNDTIYSSQCKPTPASRAIRSQFNFSSSSTPRVKATPAFQPPKRNLSAIYQVPAKKSPLKPNAYNIEYVPSVGFRQRDGSISKIHSLVQKPAKTYYMENVQTETFTDDLENIEVTIQDMINGNISQTFANSSTSEYTLTNSNRLANNCDYSNMVALTDVMLARREQRPLVKSMNDNAVYSVYHHKKIRAEQIRNEKPSPTELYVPCNTANEQQSLPTLTDVFSQMKDPTQTLYVQFSGETERDCTTSKMRSVKPAQQNLPKITNAFSNFMELTQPLYVQVSAESERTQSIPFCESSNSALEQLYNFKPEFLKNQPSLLQIAPTTNTKCVFSTPTISSAKQQNTCAAEAYPLYDPLEQDSQCANYDAVSQNLMDEYTEQEMTLRKYHEASLISNSDSSLGTMDSQELETTVPEMVEDAMEIISQDGDYMERIEMDSRMQCILCSWAGSKIVLYNHIKQEHHSQIHIQEREQWIVTYRLGSLVSQPVWLSHVSEHRGMFILSVKYEDPDCFMASLTTLSSHPVPKTGLITLFNKVSGEPFSWQGPIPQLPSNMPYDNGPDIFKIELSKLELLPNSANLKLLNRSLVLNSPSKVVVGQPALNDIFINVFVNILD